MYPFNKQNLQCIAYDNDDGDSGNDDHDHAGGGIRDGGDSYDENDDSDY